VLPDFASVRRCLKSEGAVFGSDDEKDDCPRESAPNGPAIISTTVKIKPRRMHHFPVGAPAGSTQLGFHCPRCKSIARSRRFSSELSQAKLFCFISIHSVGRMQYQEIAFAMCPDGQFDDARCNITLVTSFTIALGNAVKYARVTDFRCEATGQISDVVARETAKQIPSESFKSNGYFHGATRSSSRGGLTRRRRPRVVASLLILFT